MIAELFEEESVEPNCDLPNSRRGYQDTVKPARIRVYQVGSVKPMPKEQVQRCLWQHSAEDWKEIGLLFQKDKQWILKAPRKLQKAVNPVQIHTLRMPEMQKEKSTAWVRVLKTKPVTKKQAQKDLQQHNQEKQKEIALELLKENPDDQLTPKLVRLRKSLTLITMGNITAQKASPILAPERMGILSIVKDIPKDWDTHTERAIVRIHAMSTSNLARGWWITKGYAAMAIKIEECKIDKELAEKFPDRVNYKPICQHMAKLKKLAKRDPKLGQQKLQAYKLERQKAACNEGWLPQDSGVTFKPSDLLKDQEVNALYIPMHAWTKLGTHVLPVLVDTGAT